LILPTFTVGGQRTVAEQRYQGRPREGALVTKFGDIRSDNGDFLGINGRPLYVRAACEASLKRLIRRFVQKYGRRMKKGIDAMTGFRQDQTIVFHYELEP
jgi:hypothetical protein